MKRSTAIGIDEARWWTLERRAGETLRAALERTLREAISSGALREGVRLPASRILAAELGVSRGVVSDAYGQLEAQGYLIARPRAAPVVAPVPRPQVAPSTPEPKEEGPRYDLTPTTPDVTLFPLRRWLGAQQVVQPGRLPAARREDAGQLRDRRRARCWIAELRSVATEEYTD